MPWEYVTIGDTSKKILADVVDTDKYVQGIKLVDPTDAATTPLVVMQGSQPTLPQSIIGVDGLPLTFASDITIEATPSIDAGAYSDGDNLDGAIISFANATAVTAGSGYIDSVTIIDKSGSGSTGKNMMVAFCRSSITPNSQNSAFTLTDAQMEEVVARVTTVDAQWYNMGGGSMAQVPVSPPLPFKLPTGTTLYAVVKLIGAFTFGAVNDVIIRVHIVRN
jgi:hypothetical protein